MESQLEHKKWRNKRVLFNYPFTTLNNRLGEIKFGENNTFKLILIIHLWQYKQGTSSHLLQTTSEREHADFCLTENQHQTKTHTQYPLSANIDEIFLPNHNTSHYQKSVRFKGVIRESSAKICRFAIVVHICWLIVSVLYRK